MGKTKLNQLLTNNKEGKFMNNRVRKNSFWTSDQVEAIETIAQARFGSRARWSQTLNYLMDKILPPALEELSRVEDERLHSTRLALEIQRKRIASAELGQEYTSTLDGLMA